MIEWLIIGGGIHGTHLAVQLLHRGVAPESVSIVDPEKELLERWTACTRATGMTHLRSPSVHHIAPEPWALQRFAGRRKRRPPRLFIPPYDRPALWLFNSHCKQVIADYGLTDLHRRAWAEAIRLEEDGAVVDTTLGQLHARRVVLALSLGTQPRWPAWARELERTEPQAIHHLFDASRALAPVAAAADVAVIGAGISAIQYALSQVSASRTVHVIARHPIREHQFDSDPGWVGPKYMAGFQKVASPAARRRIIDAARHRGSVPPEVRRALQRAVNDRRIAVHRGEVARARPQGAHVDLELDSGAHVGASRVVLATGFEAARPGGALIDRLIESASLPCSECGYPLVDRHLHWGPGVFVTGPLAELELGPSARNIAGARAAAERITARV